MQMKPLLSKTTKPFLTYVLIVLAVSVPTYYFVVDTIWQIELDEHNQLLADKTEFEFNRLKLSEEKLLRSIVLWDEIQPSTAIRKIGLNDSGLDSTYTLDKQKSYSQTVNLDRFRCLSTVILLNGKPYRFIVETNIEEIRETVAVIAVTTIFFFIIIVIGLLMITRKLSLKVWQPFRDILEKLKAFNLNQHTHIEFEKTDVKEFEELNQSLDKLIEHNVSAFKTQKEFTENASHELQTPLAILKSKLDILLQSDGLTENQYNIVEEMNRTLTRSSRINKNLLLLAKIDNGQFDSSETIQFKPILEQYIALLQEHFEHKKLELGTTLLSELSVNGNNSLTEILINNLLMNAIRHTAITGVVSVTLINTRLEIANTGEQALLKQQLFKRFSRQSTDNNGSGLGLAIIAEICKFHQWEVGYKFEDQQHIFYISF